MADVKYADLQTVSAKMEEPTAKLRWVPRSLMGMEMKLQQAWQVTLYDESSRPWKMKVEWRDVPSEFNPKA